MFFTNQCVFFSQETTTCDQSIKPKNFIAFDPTEAVPKWIERSNLSLGGWNQMYVNVRKK